MLLVLNMRGFWIYLSQNKRKFRFLKYKRFFRFFSFLKHKEFWGDFHSSNIRKAFFWEKIRNFLGVSRDGFFFTFSSLKSYFLKYKKLFRVSISWDIRKFRFLKYKKRFILRKCKKFLNIRTRKFHFPRI